MFPYTVFALQKFQKQNVGVGYRLQNIIPTNSNNPQETYGVVGGWWGCEGCGPRRRINSRTNEVTATPIFQPDHLFSLATLVDISKQMLIKLIH